MSTLTIRVLAKTSVAPTVSAGLDQSIQLPVSTAQLLGTAEPNSQIASTLWTQISGPAKTISNATSLVASVSSLSAGNYVFKLTATTIDGQVGEDTVNITVAVQITNQPPTAVNKTIPFNYNQSVPALSYVTLTLQQLTSTYSDPEGTSPSKVEVISVPSVGELYNTVTGSVITPGSSFSASFINLGSIRFYPNNFANDESNGSMSTTFQIRIFDSGTPQTASNTITLTLNATNQANQPPVVQLQAANFDGTATGNTSSSIRAIESATPSAVFIKAIVSDPESNPLNYSWSFVSGNISGDTISARSGDNSVANLSIRNTVSGTRVIRIKCVINDGNGGVTEAFINHTQTVSSGATNSISGDTILDPSDRSGNGTLNINKSGGGLLKMSLYGGESAGVEDSVLTISIAGVGVYSLTAVPYQSTNRDVSLPRGTFTYTITLSGFVPTNTRGSVRLG